MGTCQAFFVNVLSKNKFLSFLPVIFFLTVQYISRMVLFRLIASDMSTLYMYSGKFCLSLLLRIFLHTVYSGKVPCRLIASNISISIQGKLCLGLLPVKFV